MTREEVVKSREYQISYAACKYADSIAQHDDRKTYCIEDFEAGANWADEHLQNHWHDAESDDLPPYDKEVIVLCRRAEYFQEVCFAHRPDPKGWYAKSLATGKIEHYRAETYGKGGWNIDGVKWWLDVELPKMEEEEQ